MRKLLLTLLLFVISSVACFAAKIPDEVKDYINEKIPNTDIRFDGVIILPDNTVYLPLYPSLFSDINSLEIKETFPANTELSEKPDIVIFNNDFVLMKVLVDSEGRKTVLKLPLPDKRGINHAKCPKCKKSLTLITFKKQKIELITKKSK